MADTMKTDTGNPVGQTHDYLASLGFGVPDTRQLLVHADGRIAAVLSTGVHQIFERINDAVAWVRQHEPQFTEIEDGVEGLVDAKQ